MKPLVARYLPLPVDTKPVWFFRDVRRALEAHERGDFYESALLADALGRIPRIAGPLETRAGALVAKGCGTSFRLEPPKGYEEDEGAKKLCEDVDSWWFDSIPDYVVESIIQDVCMLGLAYGRRKWFERDGQWHVELEPWHLQHLSFDETIGKYRVNTMQGSIVIEPDDPNWYVYEPKGPRSWMHGAIRAISDVATYRNDALRDWARYCERHGMPILVIEEPVGSAQVDRDIFFKKIQTMGSDATARVPRKNKEEGYDLRYVEPKNGEAWRTFQAFIDALSNEFIIRIKGNNLTTEVKGGSYAAATVHAQVDLMILTSDSRIGTFFRKYVVLPWCQYNVPDFDRKKCPWPIYDTSPPADLVARANVYKTFGEAATSLEKRPCYFDAEKAMVEFNIPRLTDEKIKELQAEEEAEAEAMRQQMQQGIGGEGGSEEMPPGKGDPGKGEAPKAKTGALAARDRPPSPWLLMGQNYVDRRAARAQADASNALAADLETIMRVVRENDNADAIKLGLERAFPTLRREALAEVIGQSLILAELAGRLTILGDL